MNGSQPSSKPNRSHSAKIASLLGESHNVPLWKSPTWFWELSLIALLLVSLEWLGSLFDIAGLPLPCFRPAVGAGFLVLWFRGLDRWPVVLLSSLLGHRYRPSLSLRLRLPWQK
ncbi:MAG: hypothetical protein NT013_19685 [Planctomycetia bacterium]|nr:hypothetical protein [Planctomycetia bacterium]